MEIDLKKGGINAFENNGKKLLETPLEFNFWRAPNDNDRGNGALKRLDTWRYAGKNSKVLNYRVENLKDRVIKVDLEIEIPTKEASQLYVTYLIDGNGEILVDSSLYSPKTLPEIPEFSMITELSPKSNRVKWYGRGPEENYIDRKTGYDIGVYEEDVENFFIPYINPSETGNRGDIRWVEVTDNNGEGVLITSIPERESLEFNTLYYTPEELSSGKRHPFELTKNKNVVLRVIGKQMGVGGDNSWGARPHDQYQLKSGEVQRYTFKIMGKNSGIDAMEKRDKNLALDSKNYFEAKRSIEQVADNVVYLSDLDIKNIRYKK